MVWRQKVSHVAIYDARPAAFERKEPVCPPRSMIGELFASDAVTPHTAHRDTAYGPADAGLAIARYIELPVEHH